MMRNLTFSTHQTSTLIVEVSCFNLTDLLLWEQIGYGIIVPTISAIGVFCNILNLVILSNPLLSESTYTYLYALAWANFLSLFLFFFSGVARGYFPCEYFWNIYQIYVYLPLGFMTTACSVCFTVAVTIERFIIVYFPLKGKLLMFQSDKAKLVVGILTVICVLYNIPKFFIFYINSENRISYTEFGKSKVYEVLSWIHFIVLSIISSILLIVINILLIRRLRKNLQKKKTFKQPTQTDKIRQDQHRLTKTLIAIIFVYVIGELPSTFLSRGIVVGVFGGGDPAILTLTPYRHATVVATILTVSHLSMNFVFYCVFNQKFLTIFKQKICPCMNNNKVNGSAEVFVTDTCL